MATVSRPVRFGQGPELEPGIGPLPLPVARGGSVSSLGRSSGQFLACLTHEFCWGEGLGLAKNALKSVGSNRKPPEPSNLAQRHLPLNRTHRPKQRRLRR